MADDEQNCPKESITTSLYKIVVEGELHESWTDRLGNVDLQRRIHGLDSCHTILLSEIPDQAALRGLLNRIWDLNLEIISLNKTHQGAADE
jgi:hypothetical protein